MGLGPVGGADPRRAPASGGLCNGIDGWRSRRRSGEMTCCRSCGAPLGTTVLDLGEMPLANRFPSSLAECATEPRYPLKVRLCEQCWLMQLEGTVSPDEMFSEYAYFSSFSQTWLRHSRAFARAAVERWDLDPKSLVVEVASNDGHLLACFAELGPRVLGIDPAANVAAVAREAGIPTEVGYLGRQLAERL